MLFSDFQASEAEVTTEEKTSLLPATFLEANEFLYFK